MVRSFAPAVIIGLGGTGQLALIRIKKMFIEQCGLVPPCIKLLAFDTTPDRETASSAAVEKIEFDDSEFCHMKVRSVASAIRNSYVEAWWVPYDPLNRSTVSDGTGGIREVGRLATFANIDTIVDLLKRAFERVHKQGMEDDMQKIGLELLESSNAQVFVVGSLAGGTGSGSFVDFSILCRSLGGQNMFYTAYFVMPWVFRDVAKTCFENGYAALLELEKLNAASPENPYVVNYTYNLEKKLEERPYHIVNLIDGRCRNGGWILSRKEVPAFVGESIFNSVGGVAKRYRQIADNVLTMIHLALAEPERWEGQQAIYSTTGVSSIVYPAAQIHERLKAQFAAGLIDHTLAFIKGTQVSGQASEASEAVGAEFRTFLAKEQVTMDDSGLLNLIQQMPESTYSFDDRQLGLNLRDAKTQNNVMTTLKDWRDGVKREWEQSRRDDEVTRKVDQAVNELLNRIRGYEQNKRAGFPEGSHNEANQYLLSHWEDVLGECTAAYEELRKRKADLERTVSISAEEITKRISTSFWASTNPVRNACMRHSDAVVELLRHDLEADRLNRAIKLCDIWKEQAVARDEEIQTEKDSLKTVASDLRNLKLRLESRVNRLSVSNMLKQKAMLEIYVGVQETSDDQAAVESGVILVQEGYKDCATVTTERFEEFRKRHKINEPSSLNSLSDKQRESALLEFADEMVRPATDLSVVQVLKQMDKEDDTAIERLTERAVRTSSQMLPIDENALTGRSDIITEFTVIGGAFDDAGVRDSVFSCLPGSRIDKVQNVWAETGDPHRLTFANYLSVIPLYVLDGIENSRERYLMRVRPPSHTDKMFEFPLVDILPGKSARIEVLKLLSLSTLKSTDLVQRLPLERPIGTSNYYYRLNPDLFRAVDESQLTLPGTPGKFYSLYEQLCSETRAPLRKRLRQALLDISRKEGFSSEAILAEIQKAYNQFRETLNEKEFNKAVTGTLYRQQMVYFRKLLEMDRQKFSLANALDLRLSFQREPQ